MLSVFDHGAFAPCPAPFNMAAHVLSHAEDLPDKTALEVIGADSVDDWSFARLGAAVRGTGTGLLQSGLKPGDRVLMRLGNTVEFPIAYLGAIAVGLVPIPTSSQLTEAEVAKVIEITTPRAILRGDGIACPQTAIPVLDEAALLQLRALPPADWHMDDPERPGYIIFTSGTSGVPRAVVHAHRAIWARQMMHEGWYGLSQSDRLLHAGAFNWTYTLGTGLMDPWSVGATALIPAPGTDPAELPALMAARGATIFAAAPGVYRKFLTQDMPPLPHLRHGLSAGEKLSETIRTGWQASTGTPIYEAFGMSECSTFISSGPAHPADPRTLGRPQTGRIIALLGPDGTPVPLGDEGTIAVHRTDPGLMLGYLGAPEATAEKYQGDWFLTGDQAHMDDDGQITYHGRGDDMMNAGGYRVSPIEVETALAQHPQIATCAVTDIEVKQDARLIMAFYTAPAPIDDASLTAHAAAHLAPYKRPRGFFHVETLPMGNNNKILRRALGDVYKALHDQA